MPTGAGKTVIFCKMIRDAAEKSKQPGVVVRGRKLVDQASKRLFREGVNHGVLMASHWNYKPTLPVQACSIDTLISREIDLKRFGFLIVDEAHLFSSNSEGGKMIKNYSGYVVAVTATPYLDGGMRHIADSMIRPISMQDLIDQGHLVGFRIFAPAEPDTTHVKISSTTKDYVTEELAQASMTGELTGKIVDHYKNLGEKRPTIFFGVNVKHSKLIAEKFNSAGISAEHCDADTPEKQREAILKRSENGETKIICNVGILCTGVDLPWISCIIMGRKTTSYNLFIQQAGRGTRTFDGKSDCLLLDHAGNVRKHGFPTFEPEVDLDGKIKSESYRLESKICKQCFCVFRGKGCPTCGRIESQTTGDIIESEAKLEEIKIKEKSPIERHLIELEIHRKRTNKKPGWQYWKLLERFSYEEALFLLPYWFRERYKKQKEFDKGIDDVIAHPFSKSKYKGWGK